VKEVGTNVHRFKVGDHVGVGTYVNSCRDCEFCNKKLEVHCAKGPVYTFNRIDTDGTITKGGYSDYIVVHERQVLYIMLYHSHTMFNTAESDQSSTSFILWPSK
jgi:cinnamyl-alcohol dehydrogenase